MSTPSAWGPILHPIGDFIITAIHWWLYTLLSCTVLAIGFYIFLFWIVTKLIKRIFS
jgi:hypothetical protein